MPNLVGIWNPAIDEQSVRQVVGRQLERVRIRDMDYSEYAAIFPGFGMAMQDHDLLENGMQPAFSPDGQIALLLDGEINNANELRHQFSAKLDTQRCSTAELALQLIAEEGPDVARLFNGFFSILVYEPRPHRLSIISDRYAARQLFYVQRGKTVLFGTELKALAVADTGSRKIDEVGLME